MKFLGKNWTAYKVQSALAIINDKKVDQEAVREIPTLEQASVFRQSIQKYDIPKKKHKPIAKAIKTKGIGKRDIPAEVAKHAKTPTVTPMKEPEQKIQRLVEDIDKQSRALTTKINQLNTVMRTMKINELGGVQAWLANNSRSALIQEIHILKGQGREAN